MESIVRLPDQSGRWVDDDVVEGLFIKSLHKHTDQSFISKWLRDELARKGVEKSCIGQNVSVEYRQIL